MLLLFQKYRREEENESEAEGDDYDVYVPVKERKKQKIKQILKISQVSKKSVKLYFLVRIGYYLGFVI